MKMTGNIRTDIASLLEKYMDGETSNQEEALLRSYFATAGNDIPKEWRAYKALFAYEKEETCALQAKSKKESRGRRRIRILRITGMATAAASVAILICLFFALPQEKKNYAMIDGKKYTGKEIVMKEAEDALMLVSTNEDETFDALGQMQ